MTRAAKRASLAVWRRRLAYRRKRYHRARRRQDHKTAWKWQKLLRSARYMVSLRERQLDTIGDRMLRAAEALVGVMEQGGNNTGPTVDRIIRANGGAIGEPWCGDFVAYCARQAGSKAVTREWASVRLLRRAAGLRQVSTPRPGDIIIFSFDHTGLYVGQAGAFDVTIEGNTGTTGAVSDSSTGGDGVYKKRRPRSLVAAYLRVTR